MTSRFVSVVGLYGPKNGPVGDFLAGLQALIAEYAGAPADALERAAAAVRGKLAAGQADSRRKLPRAEAAAGGPLDQRPVSLHVTTWRSVAFPS